jgi:hypothetical protein
MNDTELRAHLAEKHPGIGLATGPTGMYPEGRPTMHLEVSHDGMHRDYPESQDHTHDEPTPVTVPGAWPADELRALVMTAGELWDNIDRTRAGEYLSLRQMEVLDKAHAAYYAELRSLWVRQRALAVLRCWCSTRVTRRRPPSAARYSWPRSTRLTRMPAPTCWKPWKPW